MSRDAFVPGLGPRVARAARVLDPPARSRPGASLGFTGVVRVPHRPPSFGPGLGALSSTHLRWAE